MAPYKNHDNYSNAHDFILNQLFTKGGTGSYDYNDTADANVLKMKLWALDGTISDEDKDAGYSEYDIDDPRNHFASLSNELTFLDRYIRTVDGTLSPNEANFTQLVEQRDNALAAWILAGNEAYDMPYPSRPTLLSTSQFQELYAAYKVKEAAGELSSAFEIVTKITTYCIDDESKQAETQVETFVPPETIEDDVIANGRAQKQINDYNYVLNMNLCHDELRSIAGFLVPPLPDDPRYMVIGPIRFNPSFGHAVYSSNSYGRKGCRAELFGATSSIMRGADASVSRKAHIQFRINGDAIDRIGIVNGAVIANDSIGEDANGYAFLANGNILHNGVETPYGNAWPYNAIISIALDGENEELYFAVNGAWQNGGDPAANTNPAFTGVVGAWYPAIQVSNSTTVDMYSANNEFVYVKPAAYLEWVYDLWTESVIAGEYYYKGTLPFAPPLPPAATVTLGGTPGVEGIVGSLAANEYGFGDIDGLGYTTMYVNVGGDPDDGGFGYIQQDYVRWSDSRIVFVNAPTKRVQVGDAEGDSSHKGLIITGGGYRFIYRDTSWNSAAVASPFTSNLSVNNTGSPEWIFTNFTVAHFYTQDVLLGAQTNYLMQLATKADLPSGASTPGSITVERFDVLDERWTTINALREDQTQDMGTRVFIEQQIDIRVPPNPGVPNLLPDYEAQFTNKKDQKVWYTDILVETATEWH